MASRLLGASLFTLIVLAGCTAPTPIVEMEESPKPTSTRQSRGEGTVAEMAYASLSTNNTTELHFAKGGMMRWAPDGFTPQKDALNTLPQVGLFFIGTARLIYPHVATNNGTIRSAVAQLWFEVREPTPAAYLLFFGSGFCNFGMQMSIEAATPPRRFQTIQFCPGTGLPLPAVLERGLHSVNLTAQISSPVTVKLGDRVTFSPMSNAITSDQRPSVFFVYGSKAHDSVVRFEGWEEPKKATGGP